MNSKKIKVLVVDDSAVVRRVLTRSLNSAPDIEVVATAADPFEAREKLRLVRPDVMTLDVVMPKMDGIDFLRNLMRERPMPVLMVAAQNDRSKQDTLSALELGAVDFVLKPAADLRGDLTQFTSDLQDKVRTAAKANILHLINRRKVGRRRPAAEPGHPGMTGLAFKHIVAIGASTGGTEAIREVLSGLPGNCPPILMAQHIPSNFSTSFAQRLDENCDIRVVEATHEEPIQAGTAYLAPGDFHLSIRVVGNEYRCWLDQLPKVNRHRPSVDVLFESVANTVAGGRAIGVLLTGMGADGASGLRKLRDAGCYTIVQDEASSVVWGMPGTAVKLGAAERILPLEEISAELGYLPRRRSVSGDTVK